MTKVKCCGHNVLIGWMKPWNYRVGRIVAAIELHVVHRHIEHVAYMYVYLLIYIIIVFRSLQFFFYSCWFLTEAAPQTALRHTVNIFQARTRHYRWTYFFVFKILQTSNSSVFTMWIIDLSAFQTSTSIHVVYSSRRMKGVIGYL